MKLWRDVGEALSEAMVDFRNRDAMRVGMLDQFSQVRFAEIDGHPVEMVTERLDIGVFYWQPQPRWFIRR